MNILYTVYQVSCISDSYFDDLELMYTWRVAGQRGISVLLSHLECISFWINVLIQKGFCPNIFPS